MLLPRISVFSGAITDKINFSIKSVYGIRMIIPIAAIASRRTDCLFFRFISGRMAMAKIPAAFGCWIARRL